MTYGFLLAPGYCQVTTFSWATAKHGSHGVFLKMIHLADVFRGVHQFEGDPLQYRHAGKRRPLMTMTSCAMSACRQSWVMRRMPIPGDLGACRVQRLRHSIRIPPMRCWTNCGILRPQRSSIWDKGFAAPAVMSVAVRSSRSDGAQPIRVMLPVYYQ